MVYSYRFSHFRNGESGIEDNPCFHERLLMVSDRAALLYEDLYVIFVKLQIPKLAIVFTGFLSKSAFNKVNNAFFALSLR